MTSLLLTVWLAAVAPVSLQDTTVVTGVTVIDGTGRDPIPDASIVIASGRIVAVGPAAAVRQPSRSRVIAARGKYVIPGLMDANVHLLYGQSIEFLARYEGRFEELIAEAAQVGLANGLTTLTDGRGRSVRGGGCR